MEDVLNTVKTKQDVLLLDEEIDTLLTGIYKPRGLERSLEEDVRKETASLIGKMGNADENKLREIKKYLSDIEYIDVTLAFDPSSKTVNKLIDWIRQNINPKLVLNIVVSPVIVGGAVIEYKGKYADYSLKNIFNQKFSAMKENLSMLLSSGTD